MPPFARTVPVTVSVPADGDLHRAATGARRSMRSRRPAAGAAADQRLQVATAARDARAAADCRRPRRRRRRPRCRSRRRRRRRRCRRCRRSAATVAADRSCRSASCRRHRRCVPLASALTVPPTATLPFTRITIGLAPTRLRMCGETVVNDASRTTMTCGPPAVVWVAIENGAALPHGDVIAAGGVAVDRRGAGRAVPGRRGGKSSAVVLMLLAKLAAARLRLAREARVAVEQRQGVVATGALGRDRDRGRARQVEGEERVLTGVVRCAGAGRARRVEHRAGGDVAARGVARVRDGGADRDGLRVLERLARPLELAELAARRRAAHRVVPDAGGGAGGLAAVLAALVVGLVRVPVAERAGDGRAARVARPELRVVGARIVDRPAPRALGGLVVRADPAGLGRPLVDQVFCSSWRSTWTSSPPAAWQSSLAWSKVRLLPSQ